jgi:phosphoribosyl 1,2-cyclic phosphodiesterase
VRAKVWGCRGSLAAPGPETVRYGGNTSCLQITPSDGRMLVIDAGTGIRSLGVALGKHYPERIDLLLTHLHLDHIEGLGFFSPVWDPKAEVHIWGPPLHGKPLRERVATYFSPPLFPVHLDEVPAVFFHDVIPDQEWQLGAATVRAQLVNHPGPTLGYRIEDNGGVLAYISDHEPAKGVADLSTTPPEWISGYSLAERSDVLLHDAQYTEEEYPFRLGWGHSSVAHTVAFSQVAKVQKLVMFHHDPLHSDAQLEAMLVRARELWGEGDDAVSLAYEGMEIEVG